MRYLKSKLVIERKKIGKKVISEMRKQIDFLGFIKPPINYQYLLNFNYTLYELGYKVKIHNQPLI